MKIGANRGTTAEGLRPTVVVNVLKVLTLLPNLIPIRLLVPPLVAYRSR